MADRKTVSQLTDDELTALYNRLFDAEQAEKRLANLREYLDSLAAVDPITGATRA
jgi:hypothetical protein